MSYHRHVDAAERTVLQQHQHDRQLRVMFKRNEFQTPIVRSTNSVELTIGIWYSSLVFRKANDLHLNVHTVIDDR